MPTNTHFFIFFFISDIDECLLNETYSCNNGTCKNQNGSWGCQCDIVLIKAKENETVITCQGELPYAIKPQISDNQSNDQ